MRKASRLQIEQLARKGAGYDTIIPIFQMRKLRPRETSKPGVSDSKVFVPTCLEKLLLDEHRFGWVEAGAWLWPYSN